MMILNGYYFAATGVSSHEFYRGDECACRVTQAGLPGEPLRVRAASGEEWAFMPSEATAPGAALPFLDADGHEAAQLCLWYDGYFAVAIPGAALTGRVIRSHLRRAILYAGIDEVVAVRLQYGLDRAMAREKFGEWFPRRYVATVAEDIDPRLLALALAVPFLGIESIEVG